MLQEKTYKISTNKTYLESAEFCKSVQQSGKKNENIE